MSQLAEGMDHLSRAPPRTWHLPSPFAPFALGHRGLILLVGVFIAVMATASTALLVIPPHFTASALVGPTARSGIAAMGARVPASASDASMALVEYGAGNETLSDYGRFLALLTSIPVAGRVAAENRSLLPQLFPERWDGAAGAWQPPGGPVATVRRWVLAAFGQEDWVVPDAHAVARYLKRRLSVSPVGSGPIYRIAFRHEDRAVAIAVVASVVEAADEHLRAEARRRSAAEITYIRSRLDDTKVVEHRAALAALLAEHERIDIMISVDLPFAADRLEPADAPRQADWPNPFAVLGVAAVAGLVLGMVAVFGRRMFATENRDHW